MVGPSSKGGYPAIILRGRNLKNVEDPSIPEYETTSRIGSASNRDNAALAVYLSKEDCELITSLFSEGEYRVYCPQKRDFRYHSRDIRYICLPSFLRDPSKSDSAKDNFIIDLKGIITDYLNNKLDKNSISANPLKMNDLIQTTNYIQNITKANTNLQNNIFNIRLLLNLLDSSYSDVEIEFLSFGNKETDSMVLNRNFERQKTLFVKTLPLTTLEKTKGFYRYLVKENELSVDMSNAKVISGKRKGALTTNSVIAPLVKNGKYITLNGEEVEVTGDNKLLDISNVVTARVGSEAVIIANVGKWSEKSDFKQAIYFVRRTDNFYELPGGGLNSLSDTFEGQIKQRALTKGDMNKEDLHELNSSNFKGMAVLLNESKTAGNEQVKDIGFSYYKLFFYEFTPKVKNPTELRPQGYLPPIYLFGKEVDNRKYYEENPLEGEPGRLIYGTWMTLQEIFRNNSMRERYLGLKPLMREATEEVKNKMKAK